MLASILPAHASRLVRALHMLEARLNAPRHTRPGPNRGDGLDIDSLQLHTSRKLFVY
jgi:hypothetical protein